MKDLSAQKGLTLASLKAFVLLGDKGGYLAACDRDQGRAANMKNQVRRLAESVGVPLTQPDGRRIRLTARGQELHNVATQILGMLDGFLEACSEEQHIVRIGAGQSFLDDSFIPHWARIHAALPGHRFLLENLQTRAVLSRLLRQEIDFGVVRRSAVPPGAGLKVWPLLSMRFALLVPETLMRTKKDGTRALPKQLKIATLPGEGEFRQQLQNFADRSRLTLKFVVECPSFSQAKALATSGSLAAVVHDVGEVPAGMIAFPLGLEDGFSRELVLAWLPRRLEAMRHLEVARERLLRVISMARS
jgi:DNA-binding transcriptional LysR family regulator